MIQHRSHGVAIGVLLLLTLALPAIVWSAEPPRFLVDLNGVRLWQLKDAVHRTWGPPDQNLSTDHSSAEVYRLGQTAYAVVEYLDSRPHNVYSLQLTGTRLPGMTPFRGLVLGDPQAKVVNALGRPSSLERVDAPQVKGTLQRYTYAGNYSVEILDGKTLYSIRIDATPDVLSGPVAGNDVWGDFRAAVLKKDMASVLQQLRPDVEIYRGDAVLTIDRAYSAFQKQPERAFLQALFGDTDSVRSVIQRAQPDVAIRVAEKVGTGRVFKFPPSEAVEEIVFFPFAGRLRVYEIKFRR